MKNYYWLLFFINSCFLCAHEPRLTIITSVFEGDRYIEHFLEQIARQTIYDQCQHVIINANSPGSEEVFILSFLKSHQNVEYCRLDKDPGLYAVWNMAIKKAKAAYLVSANLDDRLAPFAYELLLQELDNHPKIDLVYSDAYITTHPNQAFEEHLFLYWIKYSAPEFSYKVLQERCFIGSHPIWRKSMHDKYGLFNENFLCAGDWEMWLRAASQGALFLHVNQVTSVNYSGPEELTNRKDLIPHKNWEGDFLNNNYLAK